MKAVAYYSTYINGRAGYLQSSLQEISALHRLPSYRSCWRVLHIDGFESGYGMNFIRFNFHIKPDATLRGIEMRP